MESVHETFRRGRITVSGRLEFVLRVILLGIGATLVMDAWAFLLRLFGIPSLNLALLGRWIGHLRRGQWMHASIAKSAPVRGELLIGWCAHYSIGIAFAALLLATFGLKWAQSPSLAPALLIGIVTVLAPLLILQPALGAGIASSKTATPVFNSMKSLVTHTVFGVGLYLTALTTASFIPAGK
jgi:Protein of unknown function (DUF2938)